MGCNTSRPIEPIIINKDYENYKGAGVCFKNETHILGGVQTCKKEKVISGIGGKREKTDESYYHTAYREMLEELFGINPNNELIQTCFRVKPKKVQYFTENNYVILVYDFKQLNEILKNLKQFGVKTKIYKTFPTNLEELILKRERGKMEITDICLFSLETTKYDKWFLDDISKL